MKKLYIDCTYVYHSALNTGIQRVVRSVATHIKPVALKMEYEAELVVFGLDNVRRVDYLPFHSKSKKAVDRYNKIRFGIAKYIPFASLKHFILASKTEFGLNWLIFATMIKPVKRIKSLFSSTNQPALTQGELLHVKSGDLLLLLDSTWHLDHWQLIESMKTQGVKVITVIYDLIPIQYPQYCDEGLVKAFSFWLENVNRLSDGYIAISRSVRDELYSFLHTQWNNTLGMERFESFYLGADFAYRQGNFEQARDRIARVLDGSSVYLMVSTLEARKNHEMLLDAFEELWSRGHNIKLLLIGKEGWRVEALIKRIKAHREWKKRLIWFDDADDAELVYAYKHAKALIFASKAEGFGLPIIEGLYFGLPVMASDIAVHREVGAHHVAYFDPDGIDELVQMIENMEQGMSWHTPRLGQSTWPTWQESAAYLMEKIIQLEA